METHFMKMLFGYGLSVLTCIMWTASSAAVQVLERKVPDFQLSFFRYVGLLLIAAILLRFNKKEFELPRESYVHVLLIGICTVAYNILHFFAVSIVPLSYVSVELVCTMIVIAIISKISFDKSPNIILSICIFGCILGMIFLSQPWIHFTHGFAPGFATSKTDCSISTTNSTTKECKVKSPARWVIFGLIALVSAAGIEAIFMQLAGNYLKMVKPGPLIFAMAGVAMPLCLVCSLYLEEPIWITEPYIILLVSIHVVGAGLSLACEVTSCQLISPLHVSIIKNLETVLSLILQYTVLTAYLYGRRNLLEAAGCVIIIISISLSAMFNNEEKHEDFEN